MKEIFPEYQFDLDPIKYQLLTPANIKELPEYMKSNNLSNLIIMQKIWTLDYLPYMGDFKFLKKLRIMSTSICDLSPIHDCTELEELALQNGDKTKLDYACFPKLKIFSSYEGSGVKKIWDVPNLLDLALSGLKRQNYNDGIALDSLETLSIGTSPIEDLYFLARARNLKTLHLRWLSKLSDFEFLKHLKQLSFLNIIANKMTDFSFLKYLPNLEYCYLESKIAQAKVDDFMHLNKLKGFSVKGNDSTLKVSKEFCKLKGLD